MDRNFDDVLDDITFMEQKLVNIKNYITFFHKSMPNGCRYQLFATIKYLPSHLNYNKALAFLHVTNGYIDYF